MESITVAFFISPHGFGHAARSSAVMESIRKIFPKVIFDIYTLVPEWFFQDSLRSGYRYHSCLTDIGVVQNDPLKEDLPETINRLGEMVPFSETQVKILADELNNRCTRIVLCDISPLGIIVAKRAGIPSILIENFTWDWIYEGYLTIEPRFKPFIDLLNMYFSQADYHIQAQPLCEVSSSNLVTQPIARKSRNTREITRSLLGIKRETPTVLLTMGGIEARYDTLKPYLEMKDINFIIPAGAERPQKQDNLVLLPHHSMFYHPDLVFASDAVIGKIGYSTISETYFAGIPFGFIKRENFRESSPLAAYIQKEMPSMEVQAEAFASGAWLAKLPELLDQSKVDRRETNGADQAAKFITNVGGLS